MSAFLLALAGLGWAGGWLIGWGRRMPRPTAASGDEPPSVSVIVPARNEARRLPRLLRGLDGVSAEVIVVDDESADGTAELARSAGARVISTVPPEGWTGKTWACWIGARAASGDVLVFLDADVEPGPATVATVARHARDSRGLVSVLPWHRTERPYEQLSAIPSLMALMGSGTGPAPRRGWSRRPSAFGMVLAVPADVYFAAGGHGAVRSDVAEDVALAQVLGAWGASVSTWCGGVDARVRMYGEGPAQLFEGWSKNLSRGASSVPPLRLLCAVAWISAVLQACVVLLAGALGIGTVSLVVSLGIYVAFAVQAAVLTRRIGSFALGALVALPVLAVGFVVMFAASARSTVARREVAWRGRRIRVGSGVAG